MSGLLWPKWLPITELFRGCADPSPNGLVETTTPPETGVGPEGTLPERWLAVTSMPLAPRSAMPIPENATLPSSIPVGHFLVLFSTVLAFTSKPPTGWPGKASKNMPAQLSWIVFPAKEPWWAPPTQMPHGPREMRLPTTLASLLAPSGPKMVMPVLPKRLTSLERILVPVESMIAVPPMVLSVMSLEMILVPGDFSTNTPNQLPMRSFPAIVVLVASLNSIACVNLGKFLTVFSATVVVELISTAMPEAWLLGSPMTSLFVI